MTVFVPQDKSLSGGPSITMPPGPMLGLFLYEARLERLGEWCSRLVRQPLSPAEPSLPSGLSSDCPFFDPEHELWVLRERLSGPKSALTSMLLSFRPQPSNDMAHHRLHKQGTLMDWAERSYRFGFVVLSIFSALGAVWMILSL